MKKKTNKAPLTLLTLLSFEMSSYGYLGASVRSPHFWARKGDVAPYSAAEAVDQMVVEAANQFGMSEHQFEAFVNSGFGRWLGEELSSQKLSPAMTEKARAYMVKFLNDA